MTKKIGHKFGISNGGLVYPKISIAVLVFLATSALSAAPSAPAAKELKNGPKSDPALIGIGRAGFLATLSSNFKDIPRPRAITKPKTKNVAATDSTPSPNPDAAPAAPVTIPTVYDQYFQELKLSDFSTISGWYFPAPEGADKPLLIVNFGALADRWSNLASGFINEVVLSKRGLLPINVFVMSSLSSAEYLAKNFSVSLGGYDEGLALLGLVDAFTQSKDKFPHTTSHIMGVNNGGTAVIQALIEEQRLGTKRVASGIAFNAAIDHESITKSILKTFGKEDEVVDPSVSKLGVLGTIVAGKLFDHFNQIATYFKLTDIIGQAIPRESAGQIFYTFFKQRLAVLKATATPANWNPTVANDTVENYLRTSNALIENIKCTDAPLFVIHAKNDFLIPYEPFKRFTQNVKKCETVITHSTRNGGHWGYLSTYGAKWIADMIRETIKRQVH